MGRLWVNTSRGVCSSFPFCAAIIPATEPSPKIRVERTARASPSARIVRPPGRRSGVASRRRASLSRRIFCGRLIYNYIRARWISQRAACRRLSCPRCLFGSPSGTCWRLASFASGVPRRSEEHGSNIRGWRMRLRLDKPLTTGLGRRGARENGAGRGCFRV